jgi:hypothetical protein
MTVQISKMLRLIAKKKVGLCGHTKYPSILCDTFNYENVASVQNIATRSVLNNLRHIMSRDTKLETSKE